jgi:hypothetical protein
VQGRGRLAAVGWRRLVGGWAAPGRGVFRQCCCSGNRPDRMLYVPMSAPTHSASVLSCCSVASERSPLQKSGCTFMNASARAHSWF